MIIKNMQKNLLEIEFNLTILKERYLKKEDFCFNLIFKIRLENKELEYDAILINIGSLKGMFKTFRKFANNEDEEQLYYEPLESDFWIYIPRPFKTKKDIVKELINAGMDEESLKELTDEYTHRLFFYIDEQNLNKGGLSGTGISYCLDVSKIQLNEFVNSLETQYNKLIDEAMSCI